MTGLDSPVYLEHIRRESARFRQVLGEVDPAKQVPSCPAWTASDLLWHLTRVQRFWARVIRERPAAPSEAWPDPVRPESHAALLGGFEAGNAEFLATLAAADPAEPAWSWSSEQSVGFSYRRQAHEALIHRLDAELTAERVTALDPVLAADGVEECLALMYGGAPPWGRFAPLEHYVEFRLRDAGRSVWVQLGTLTGTKPDGTERSAEPDLVVVPEPGRAADAVVSGAAGEVDGWLWHRLDDSGITITGDRGVYARARLVLEQPIT